MSSCLSQFSIIDPRYDPREPAQVLTSARQFKKRVGAIVATVSAFTLHVSTYTRICQAVRLGDCSGSTSSDCAAHENCVASAEY
jgi:hypothetical protein